jgi:putative membrane protein
MAGHTVGMILSRWNLEPQIILPIVLTGWLYLLGVRRIRRRRGAGGWRTSCSIWFLAGVTVLFLALASPIDVYSDRLLSVHMVQHLLLMQVAAPLLLLGKPITLALAASTGSTRARLSAVAHSSAARVLGSPVVCFCAFALTLWVSHFSRLYEATLTDTTLHAAEHVVFLTAALLFWWPVVARDPGSARLSHPARLFYLFLSMPVMSLLGFVISSSDRILYAHYLIAGSALGVSALTDQRLAGTIMWESSMLVSAVALAVVLLDWMERDEREGVRADLRRGREGVGLAPWRAG